VIVPKITNIDPSEISPDAMYLVYFHTGKTLRSATHGAACVNGQSVLDMLAREVVISVYPA
jgi:hypothetical protein